MTIAELRKELEKYNDNDVIIVKDIEFDPWGHQKTTYNEVAKILGARYKVMKAEKWEKLNKEN